MISNKQKQAILHSMKNPCLMASEEETKRSMELLELLEPSIKINADNRMILGMGHNDKTFLGLYRTLKSRIFSDESREKKLVEGLKKIEDVALNRPETGMTLINSIIHQLKDEKVL